LAKPTQKITFSQSRDIPLNKLVLSQANVRRAKAGVSIEELAEDIARRTLLQSLTVRPVLDDNGTETGMFEIPAGGRRYRALELLVKQKRLGRADSMCGAYRRPCRRGLACRERPAGAAPSPRSVSCLPELAREGHERGGDRGRLLRERAGRETEAQARLRLTEAARYLCRGWHDARPAHGVHGQSGRRASGAGVGGLAAFPQQRTLLHSAAFD